LEHLEKGQRFRLCESNKNNPFLYIMTSYTPPNTDTPIFDPSQFRAEIPASASTQQTITAITDLINDTQTILTTTAGIINTIGSTIFSNFNRNNQVSGTEYNIQFTNAAPNGIYTGSVYLEAQMATNATSQTSFCFVPGGYLKCVDPSGVIIQSAPTLYSFDSGPFGTYQQLFFTTTASSAGVINFYYKFVTKQTGTGTGTSNFNVNQNSISQVIRMVRIR
jgi:hypothetical protein